MESHVFQKCLLLSGPVTMLCIHLYFSAPYHKAGILFYLTYTQTQMRPISIPHLFSFHYLVILLIGLRNETAVQTHTCKEIILKCRHVWFPVQIISSVWLFLNTTYYLYSIMKTKPMSSVLQVSSTASRSLEKR